MHASSTEGADHPAPIGTLARLVRRPAPALGPGASLREALVALDRHGSEAVAVIDPGTQAPLGILTLRDVIRRVVLGAAALDLPVATVMTGGVVSIAADATSHRASVTMIRRNVRHLVLVAADGRYCGIVSQADLYGMPAARSAEIVDAIAGAPDIAALAVVAADVRAYTSTLLAEGLTATALSQQISALNDLIGLRAIDLVSAEHDLPYVPWCWMVFGSEGRLEQTLSTDQDNGLVFVAESDEEAACLRELFLPFARAVNAALDACGFPLCKGNVMAGNPELCLSASEWKDKFSNWIRVAEPQAVVNATIFFDLRALFGDEQLVTELQGTIMALVADHPEFLRSLTQASLDWHSPLGWVSGFRYDGNKEFPHTIDLKASGIRPFVDGARIWSLAKGFAGTNTSDRLRATGPLLHFRAEETAAFIGAFDQLQRLRFANQLQARVPEAANRVDPDQLNELDRQILRESLKRVKRLQQLLEVEFLRTS